MPDWRPPKGFLKGIDPRYFLDCYQEWHAFVNGWAEVIAPWPPFRKVMSEELAKEISGEYHYYMFGRAMGILTWIGIAKLIQVMF